jgi:hypothetical protein
MGSPRSDEGRNPDDRWADEEWNSFELYEKQRVRDRRKWALILTSALLVFLSLCAIPVVKERSLKWRSLRIARDLAVEVEKIKTLAIKNKKAARLVFSQNPESMNTVTIEVIDHCEDTVDDKNRKVIATKVWTPNPGEFTVLTREDAKNLDLSLVDPTVCFDSVIGLIHAYQKQVVGIVPTADLLEKRLDRASYVIIEGESAKVTIN